MSLPITRNEALELLQSMPQSQSDINHYLESEAIMKALAEKFGEDVEYWAMVGLLHDIDWSFVKDNVSAHCIKAVEILKEKNFEDEFIKNIQSHAYGMEAIPALQNKKRTKKIEYALVASETVTGLIYAYALMRGKKISDMQVKGLNKKFKDKAFAANCNRDLIYEITKTGLELSEFFKLSIEAINKIRNDIGLD